MMNVSPSDKHRSGANRRTVVWTLLFGAIAAPLCLSAVPAQAQTCKTRAVLWRIGRVSDAIAGLEEELGRARSELAELRDREITATRYGPRESARQRRLEQHVRTLQDQIPVRRQELARLESLPNCAAPPQFDPDYDPNPFDPLAPPPTPPAG